MTWGKKPPSERRKRARWKTISMGFFRETNGPSMHEKIHRKQKPPKKGGQQSERRDRDRHPLPISLWGRRKYDAPFIRGGEPSQGREVLVIARKNDL